MMWKKLVLPIVIILIGVVSIIGSVYIKGQVTEGRKEISAGEQKLAKGKKLLFRPIGKLLDRYGRKKLDEGTRQADFYHSLANWMLIGGIVVVVIGGGVIFINRNK